ncbi:MAG: prolyl-tRNA synthetase associated domain-containing protein [Alphaproteobacteria bacterium]|nr:prolyl-tRNA synthetase associated domain-containing protein [Alphaproteobacteria bacterium]
MLAGEPELMAFLADLGIATTTHRHAPVFTVAENQALRGALPGGHCKCLFLKDKADRLWLVVALEDRRVDLKGLAKQVGAGRFSFASPDLMRSVLGVEPGAVTPFALLNEGARAVSVILDEGMLAHDPLHYHPLHNAATTAIRPANLLAFLAALGVAPRRLDLAAPPAKAGGKAPSQ